MRDSTETARLVFDMTLNFTRRGDVENRNLRSRNTQKYERLAFDFVERIAKRFSSAFSSLRGRISFR